MQCVKDTFFMKALLTARPSMGGVIEKDISLSLIWLRLNKVSNEHKLQNKNNLTTTHEICNWALSRMN